ncbi:protein of unknown function [Blastococcus saxobsidens DD2]|uniref:Uncharacterized protein n=1 Tax=Blastococcus saxobsidens (strain DD2) TaxID=1146883 RepID=H6RTQ0_BLASD|nr:protein of unknown function [Blastococcus saxobsidens DD2]
MPCSCTAAGPGGAAAPPGPARPGPRSGRTVRTAVGATVRATIGTTVGATIGTAVAAIGTAVGAAIGTAVPVAVRGTGRVAQRRRAGAAVRTAVAGAAVGGSFRAHPVLVVERHWLLRSDRPGRRTAALRGLLYLAHGRSTRPRRPRRSRPAGRRDVSILLRRAGVCGAPDIAGIPVPGPVRPRTMRGEGHDRRSSTYRGRLPGRGDPRGGRDPGGAGGRCHPRGGGPAGLPHGGAGRAAHRGVRGTVATRPRPVGAGVGRPGGRDAHVPVAAAGHPRAGPVGRRPGGR